MGMQKTGMGLSDLKRIVVEFNKEIKILMVIDDQLPREHIEEVLVDFFECGIIDFYEVPAQKGFKTYKWHFNRHLHTIDVIGVKDLESFADRYETSEFNIFQTILCNSGPVANSITSFIENYQNLKKDAKKFYKGIEKVSNRPKCLTGECFVVEMVHNIEELAELTKELTKWLRGDIRPEKLMEEIKDAEIALDNIKKWMKKKSE